MTSRGNDAGAGDLPSLGSAEAWRELVETLPQIVWITRPDGWHEHFNQQWMDFTGLTLQESLGHGWNPPFHPDDRPRAAARWEQAISTGEPYEIEYRLRRHDGVYRWMLGRARPLRDEHGEIVRWFGTCTDIDDLKRAQDELELRRRGYRLAGAMAGLGWWAIEVATGQIEWSEEVYDLLDHPGDGGPDPNASYDRFPPPHRERLQAALEGCRTHGCPVDLELPLTSYAGRDLWVRLLGEAQYDREGRIQRIAGAIQDITATKRSEVANRRLAERLTATLESITDAFCTVDAGGRFTYVNPQVERLLGRDRDELLGRHYAATFGAAIGGELEEALLSAQADRETRTLDRYHYPPLDAWFQIQIYPSEEGLAVYFRDVSDQHRAQAALEERVKELRALATVSGQAHEVSDATGLCRLTARSLVAAMQEPDAIGVRVVLGDAAAQVGEIAQDVASLSVPITSHGVPRGLIEVTDGRDVGFLPEEWDLVRSLAETLALWDRHKRAADELRRVNDALADANVELARGAQLKDDLLSMTSHELRTPLTPILGFLELLETYGHNLTDDQRGMVRSMQANARRMLRLVDDLLVLSRAAADALVSRAEDRAAQELIDPVIDELGDSLGGLEVQLDLGAHRVVADPQQVQQIVTNLLTNAAKYGRSPAVVSIEEVETGTVRVEVADHGEGVGPEFRPHMWDRFTQKDRGNTRTASGTGLGLSIVKLLAEANGGQVDYHDRCPGAVFTVDLPGYAVTSDRASEG